MQAEGRLLTEEGGQGIKREGQQHEQQQGVLPQVHAVQGDATLFSHGKGLCRAKAAGTKPGFAPRKKIQMR
ncbi:hypothetical protein D3C76_1504090 [compost metagenome]